MRASVLLGTALIVIGGTIFLRGLSAPRTILKVGDVSVSADARSPAVPWLTGLSVLARDWPRHRRNAPQGVMRGRQF